MMAKFIVYGIPVGKGRPRFAKRGNFVQAYTPQETVNYETLVRTEYRLQCEGIFFPKEVPVGMTIRAFFPIPKSVSNKKHGEMMAGAIRPIKKPDIDNIIKCIADALNTVAFTDDTQIVNVHAYKYFSDKPRVEVNIYDASR